jgi:branched-chain amino acid transport system substrate-binding protein
MNAAGIKEVMFEGVNVGEKDFSALITKIKAENVDLVYWGGLHTEGGLIVRQMRDQQVRAPMMSGDGITSAEFATIAGPGAEGTLMTYSPDPRKRPEAAQVVAAFRAKNIDPEAYTLYTYAGLQVYEQAAKAVNSIDPKRMSDHIRSGVKFNTVIGELQYNSKGDITRPDYVMYTWKKVGDKITYVEN